MPVNRVKKYILALEWASRESKNDKEFLEFARAFVKHLRARGEHKLLNRILQEFQLRWRKGPGRELLVFAREPLSKEELKRLRPLAKKAGCAIVREEREAEIGAGLALLLGSEFFVDGTIAGRIRRLRQAASNQ